MIQEGLTKKKIKKRKQKRRKNLHLASFPVIAWKTNALWLPSKKKKKKSLKHIKLFKKKTTTRSTRSNLKCQSTHSLSQHNSSTWINAQNLPRNWSSWKRPIYWKATAIRLLFSTAFWFRWVLSVSQILKYAVTVTVLVMTKRKRNSKVNAFSVATN